jgi:putative transposase
MRSVVFANGEVYHVFNRGVEKRPTFIDKREYSRAKIAADYYRYEKQTLRLSKVLQLKKDLRAAFFDRLKIKSNKVVEIICYCFMPNHFHFLLRQQVDGGVQKFMSNFTNSYTRYFNTKQKRNGPLFQGAFKAVRIEDDEQLLHVSRYIHINPVVSYVITQTRLEKYPWSSLPEYLGSNINGICDKDIVLGQFNSIKKYRDFVFSRIDYAKELEAIKHLIIED